MQTAYQPPVVSAIPQTAKPDSAAEPAKTESTDGSAHAAPETGAAAEEEKPAIEVGRHPNESIQQLVSDYPDAVGWIMAEGAGISHPFALGKSNDSYLHTALDGSYDVGGTLFLDCGANRDMQDSVTVIYGHNMKNDTMFGRLDEYFSGTKMEQYPDVYVFLPDETIHYTVWACMVVDGASDSLYEYNGSQGDISGLIDSISSRADRLNSSLMVDGSSHLLVLSTCNYSYDNARTVLVCVADKE